MTSFQPKRSHKSGAHVQPRQGKLARPVLRGPGISNGLRLPHHRAPWPAEQRSHGTRRTKGGHAGRDRGPGRFRAVRGGARTAGRAGAGRRGAVDPRAADHGLSPGPRPDRRTPEPGHRAGSGFRRRARSAGRRPRRDLTATPRLHVHRLPLGGPVRGRAAASVPGRPQLGRLRDPVGLHGGLRAFAAARRRLCPGDRGADSAARRSGPGRGSARGVGPWPARARHPRTAPPGARARAGATAGPGPDHPGRVRRRGGTLGGRSRGRGAPDPRQTAARPGPSARPVLRFLARRAHRGPSEHRAGTRPARDPAA